MQTPKSGDSCGFTTPRPLDAPDSTGMVRVPPSHPLIRYLGRVDCRDPDRLQMAYPGASIQMRFEGRRIEMSIRDHGVPEYPNFFAVAVDGGPPRRLRVSPAQRRYVLADGLGSGPHEITIVKRTESSAAGNENSGKVAFQGFHIPPDGSVHPLPDAPKYHIEFVGDSITCGYGNGVATHAPENHPFSTENADATNAYGAVAARMLGASYMLVAYSGRGVVRNYADAEGKTVPEMYLDILPDDPDPGIWDVTRVIPDLLVINLGTNDFSEGMNPGSVPALAARYRRELARFVERLRGYYPSAFLILAVGPMLSNAHPKGYNALTRVKTAVSSIVETRRAAGDGRIRMLAHAPQRAPFGEDWHPTAARHRIMAEELVDFINQNHIDIAKTP